MGKSPTQKLDSKNSSEINERFIAPGCASNMATNPWKVIPIAGAITGGLWALGYFIAFGAFSGGCYLGFAGGDYRRVGRPA